MSEVDEERPVVRHRELERPAEGPVRQSITEDVVDLLARS
jgi:hypothetical protein